MDHKVWPLVTKHVSHQQLTTPTSLMQKVDYFLAPPMPMKTKKLLPSRYSNVNNVQPICFLEHLDTAQCVAFNKIDVVDVHPCLS